MHVPDGRAPVPRGRDGALLRGGRELVSKASGVNVPGRRIHRVVEAVADAEEKWVSERPRDDAEPEVLNIQADMTGLKVRKEDLVGAKGKDGRPPKKR